MTCISYTACREEVSCQQKYDWTFPCMVLSTAARALVDGATIEQDALSAWELAGSEPTRRVCVAAHMGCRMVVSFCFHSGLQCPAPVLFTAACSESHAAGVRSYPCAGTGAWLLSPSKRAACARFKKAAYTLEFLPAAGPAAPAAGRVRDAEAKLLQKRGSLQSFEAEFQQARGTPDMRTRLDQPAGALRRS